MKAWLKAHWRTAYLAAALGLTEFVLGIWAMLLAFGIPNFWVWNEMIATPIVGFVWRYMIITNTADAGIFAVVLVFASACVLRLSVRQGLGLLSAVGLQLSVVIALFDPSEFLVHVTSFQAEYHIAPWFTNFDLGVTCGCSLIFLALVKVHLKLERLQLPLAVGLLVCTAAVGCLNGGPYVTGPVKLGAAANAPMIVPAGQTLYSVNCSTPKMVLYTTKLLLPSSAPTSDALQLADTICSAFALTYSNGNPSFNLTASIGELEG